MDDVAQGALQKLKKQTLSAAERTEALNVLKTAIKHQRIPEPAIPTVVECLRIGISSQTVPSLVSVGFSALTHLIKRLHLQDQAAALVAQRGGLLPVLLERLGDARDTHRLASAVVLGELWAARPAEVEKAVREGAVQSANPRAKIAGMQWIVKMHEEHSLQFKSFVSPMVECLEDADGTVRDAAKHGLVELFRGARDAAKADLKKQLVVHNVRKSISDHIIAQLGMAGRPETFAPAAPAPLRSQTPVAPDAAEPSLPPSADIVKIEPLWVHGGRELEDLFRQMQPCFEGRESEDNWKARDNNTLKIRRLLKGNALQDHHSIFVAEIKTLLEGILKVVNSLRTTMSSNGSKLVQELAAAMGTALDPMAEVLLRGLEKMCASTKHINGQNGNATVESILSHVSYSVRLVQHVHAASSDKNIQPRQFASQWLKILLVRHAAHKSQFEHAGALDAVDKTIRKGLADANPKVRELMRSTYWTFAKTWPDRAEDMDPKSRTLLERDSANPNAAKLFFASSVGPDASTNPRASAQARSSLRETIAAARKLPDRPNSAMSAFTPVRQGASAASRHPVQSRAAATSTKSVLSSTSSASSASSGLMSAPVRRPRKPDVPRPATADPYKGRNMDRGDDSTDNSPAASPRSTYRPTPVAAAKPASHTKSKSTTAIGFSASSPKIKSPLGSPSKPPRFASPRQPGLSSPASEDNFTMVMPDTKTGFRSQPPSSFKSRNGVDEERPRSNHSHTSQLVTVDEDNFTLVIPPKSEAPPKQTTAETVDGNARNDDAMVVYEDPAADDIAVPTLAPPAEAFQVLEEKPLNAQNQVMTTDSASPEPAADGSPTSPSQQARPEDQNGNRDKSMSPSKRQDGARSSSPVKHAGDRSDVLKARRLLASGTERVRTRTLDAHGFRRLQELIKANAATPDLQYGPLMDALISFVSTRDAVIKPGQRGQALTSLKAIVNLHAKRDKEVQLLLPATLVGISKAAAISGAVDRSLTHMELEKAADEVTKRASSLSNAQAILLRSIKALQAFVTDNEAEAHRQQRQPTAEPAATLPVSKASAAALVILSSLVTRVLASSSVKAKSPDVDADFCNSLLAVAVTALASREPDVRRRGVELALDVYPAYGGGSGPDDDDDDSTANDGDAAGATAQGKHAFWAALAPAGAQTCNLVTYYLARRGRVGAQ